MATLLWRTPIKRRLRGAFDERIEYNGRKAKKARRLGQSKSENSDSERRDENAKKCLGAVKNNLRFITPGYGINFTVFNKEHKLSLHRNLCKQYQKRKPSFKVKPLMFKKSQTQPQKKPCFIKRKRELPVTQCFCMDILKEKCGFEYCADKFDQEFLVKSSMSNVSVEDFEALISWLEYETTMQRKSRNAHRCIPRKYFNMVKRYWKEKRKQNGPLVRYFQVNSLCTGWLHKTV